MIHLHYIWKRGYNYALFLFVIVRYFLLRHNYVIYLFDAITLFHDVRITLYFGTFELCMELTLQLRLFLFVIVTYFLLCRNYVIYLFDVVTVFYDVRITLYFGTFELRMEITLQLRFAFVCHCDVFFIASQSRFLFDIVTFFDYF